MRRRALFSARLSSFLCIWQSLLLGTTRQLSVAPSCAGIIYLVSSYAFRSPSLCLSNPQNLRLKEKSSFGEHTTLLQYDDHGTARPHHHHGHGTSQRTGQQQQQQAPPAPPGGRGGSG